MVYSIASGPVAQRQSSRLISDAPKVRLLPGLPTGREFAKVTWRGASKRAY